MELPGGRLDFTFSVVRERAGGPIQGSIIKFGPTAGLGIISTEITRFGVFGNRAAFEGKCVKLTGEPCTFKVYVEDNGPTGTSDVFAIQTNDGPLLSGYLKRGDIVVRGG